MVLAVPTVNGLFYGDGDNDEYILYDTSANGSGLYVYFHAPSNTLYAALVVSRTVNDNVFDSHGGGTSAYMASAGWSNRGAFNLINSEFAQFTLKCNNEPLEWQWQQGYACKVGDEWESTADVSCSGGDDSPTPPSYTSSSSFVYNLNTYENTWVEPFSGPPASSSAPWNLYVFGTSTRDWKSPFSAADPNTVINAAEGYPASGPITYSPTYDYEWPMVYEWSVDLSTAGCGLNPVFLVTGLSHHSPSKTGATDDPFDDPPTEPLADFGDLPASYGTLIAASGARHYITAAGPYLGEALDPELDGNPSDGADGDDVASDDDEDGVVANIGSAWTAGSVRTLEITSSAAGVLGAWFDWNGDGDFDDADEYFTTAVGPGANTLAVTVGSEFDWENDSLSARFRVFSSPVSAPGGALDSGDYDGIGTDGEVEDYKWTAGSLPVSLNSFESHSSGNLLDVEWTTASETFNAGFNLWAKVDGEWKPLTEHPVPSQSSDAVTPQEYSTRIRLREIDPRTIEGLALSSIETTGTQELYGTFEVDKAYGEKVLPEPIPWGEIRSGYKQRMLEQGYVERGRKWYSAKRRHAYKSVWGRTGNGLGGVSGEAASPDGGSPTPAAGIPRDAATPLSLPSVELLVSEPGMQRVTYDELLAAGVDLAGVLPESIAVTLKGEGLPRRIRTGRGSRGFGPGGHIDFWGRKPDYPDALYLSEYIYRVEVDPSQARDAGRVSRRVRNGQTRALEPLRVNEDVAYGLGNATADPWHAAMLRHPWGPLKYTVEVEVDGALVTGRAGMVEVVLTAASDFPDVDPDHRVRVQVNGEPVLERDVSGRRAVTLEGAVPAGVLQTGPNTVSVELPGGTAAPFDIVTVDTVTLSYPRRLVAIDDRLHVKGEVTSSGVRGAGFSGRDVLGYARTGAGELYELRVDTEKTGDSWTATVPAVSSASGAANAEYWVSASRRLNRPQVLGSVDEQDLLAEPADFLLIVHPAFMPAADETSHPLYRYMKHREGRGWRVRAVALDAIQNEYGGGMALPGAVTRFLAAADEAFSYNHVLLVGDDSYDYLDKLGLGSVSFVPTVYTKAGAIHHSPSDALLTDLDSDGLGDKAVGRWPVRTLTDLEVMVDKTLAWEDPLDGPRDDRTSVWVADGEDPDVPSFEAQAERMIDTLRTPLAGGASEPWPAEHISRVYFDQVEPASGRSAAQAARDELMESLSSGRTVTGFAGHGSPTMWTFQGLLKPQHVSEMDNEGKPTLVTTLTCYTSYFVSPNTDTLAHRLMKGYRVDGQGQEVPGVANGAVAVHGAATLSGYSDNESLARAVLEHQLSDGDTLGEAIRKAREQAFQAGRTDTAKNWALLGDPTLTIGR